MLLDKLLGQRRPPFGGETVEKGNWVDFRAERVSENA